MRSLKGREKLMIPVLMIVFALGGTSYGMAEETLAFYPLIIAVMIAAGLRRAHRRRHSAARRRDRRARLDHQSVCDGHRIRLRGSSIAMGCWPADHAGGRHGHRHLLRDALRRAGSRIRASRWSTT